MYKFSFDEAIGEDDFVYKTPAEKILFACDSLTLNFVKGATLDHESEMMRSSFFVSHLIPIPSHAFDVSL